MLQPLRVLFALLLLIATGTTANATEDGFTFVDAQAKSAEFRVRDGLAVSAADQLTANNRNKEREANQTNFMVVTGAMIAALVMSLLAIHFSGNHSAEPVVMASGLILIVYGALAVTLVANTHEQLTTPIGVLGAMAGYLFGRSTPRRNEAPAQGTRATQKAP
jgi:hypothetical protein